MAISSVKDPRNSEMHHGVTKMSTKPTTNQEMKPVRSQHIKSEELAMNNIQPVKGLHLDLMEVGLGDKLALKSFPRLCNKVNSVYLTE